MEKALIIGATGYVGSAVSRALLGRGYRVLGMARKPGNRATLSANGLEPVDGDLKDANKLAKLGAAVDVVVFAPMIPFADEAAALSPLIDGLRDSAAGKPKRLLFASGSGVVSTASLDGTWSDYAAAEDDPFTFPALPTRVARLPTEALVREAASDRLATAVIRPPLIWGRAGSIQVPQIFESVKKTGSACYLGHGLNLYSNVNIDDLADLFALVVERGTPGALYHAVSGEANFREIAEAVADVAQCETRSLDYNQACSVWGTTWVDMGLAVNSRIVARRSRQELGWAPRQLDLIADIRSGSYAQRFCDTQAGGTDAFTWSSHGDA